MTGYSSGATFRRDRRGRSRRIKGSYKPPGTRGRGTVRAGEVSEAPPRGGRRADGALGESRARLFFREARRRGWARAQRRRGGVAGGIAVSRGEGAVRREEGGPEPEPERGVAGGVGELRVRRRAAVAGRVGIVRGGVTRRASRGGRPGEGEGDGDGGRRDEGWEGGSMRGVGGETRGNGGRRRSFRRRLRVSTSSFECRPRPPGFEIVRSPRRAESRACRNDY